MFWNYQFSCFAPYIEVRMKTSAWLAFAHSEIQEDYRLQAILTQRESE